MIAFLFGVFFGCVCTKAIAILYEKPPVTDYAPKNAKQCQCPLPRPNQGQIVVKGS